MTGPVPAHDEAKAGEVVGDGDQADQADEAEDHKQSQSYSSERFFPLDVLQSSGHVEGEPCGVVALKSLDVDNCHCHRPDHKVENQECREGPKDDAGLLGPHKAGIGKMGFLALGDPQALGAGG